MPIIGHLDMDAFFAAVEERDRPWLHGLPIVIGADPLGGKGRGVVSTANYAAREYGIHSAMPISEAWRLSEMARLEGRAPTAFLTPRFGRYHVLSKQIMNIVRSYSPRLEETSVDETYFEVPATSFPKAAALCRKIKQEIKEKTGLTASIGAGPNKMIAKIASDFKKPDGLTVVLPEEVEAFLEPLPVRKIPGIGPKTEEKLRRLGVFKVGEIKALSKEQLREMLGVWGERLFDKARGISDTELIEADEVVAKSVGEHETFETDTGNMNFVLERLRSLAADIVRRSRRGGFTGFRTVVLTVRFSDFETKTRSATSKTTLASLKGLEMRGFKLLLPFFEKKENPKRKTIRMIGLRIEKLS